MKLKQKQAFTQPLFPEKTRKGYTKYNSRNKDSNLVLHRVSNDIGYPQQINLKPRSLTKPKNYQIMNKQKIAHPNYDDINEKKVTIPREKYRLDPSKLLLYRKKEMQLKLNTKINLQTDLVQLQFTEPIKMTPTKMTETGFYRQHTSSQKRQSLSISFHNKKLKKSQSRDKDNLSHYQSINYDENNQTIYRMNQTQKVRKLSKNVSAFQKSKSKSKKQQSDPLDWSSKRKFKQTIIKLKQYNRIIDGSVTEAEVSQNIEKQMDLQQKRINDQSVRQKLIMQKIDLFARQKKEAIIWRNYQHLNEIQDLKIFNPKFYEQLQQSRRKRFQLLKLDLQRIQKISPIKSVNQYLIPIHTTQHIPVIEFQAQQEYVNNTQWLSERSSRRKYYDSISKIEKLKYFLLHFRKIRLSAKIFGIPQQMIYLSMFHQPEPFSLQGSFLFFKAVAAGDKQTVKMFVQQFPKVIHQVDDSGRSPLIMSTQFNFTEISKIIIQKGLNLDYLSIKGVSALQNAIKNKNKEIVISLLERGASPWSSNINILQICKDQQIYQLIKLARKLSLGMKTTKSSYRYAFWQSVKHLFRQQVQQIK